MLAGCVQLRSWRVSGGALVGAGDIATIVDEAKNILLKYNLYPELLIEQWS